MKPVQARGHSTPGDTAPLSADAPLLVDFPACIAREYPSEFDAAWDAVQRTLAVIAHVDLSPLAAHSPGLRGYDWTAYLRCSVARMVRTMEALRRQVPPGSRVLDCGSYFGNFSRMLQTAGYRVDAADSYGRYGAVFDSVIASMRAAGIQIIDTTDAGVLDAHTETYDAVLAMGVIEHVPHTPRALLNTLSRVLRPGGVIVIDTPNLGYLYTRNKLAHGDSIFCPIQLQFDTEIPFEGHHREYTIAEIQWILGAIGQTDIEIATFNYSYYGLTELAGNDLVNHRRMIDDAALREVILAISRKPAAQR